MADPDHFSLVRGGPAYRVTERLGLAHPSAARLMLKALLLILVTWAPLVVLASAEGHAIGHSVHVPLLRDPVIYTRFLFVVPVLVLAELLVETSLRVQARHLLESGVIPENERDKFESAKSEVIRLRQSATGEFLILILAVAFSFLARVVMRVGYEHTTWERVGTTTTLAGWWYALVSMPILAFFLLRWLWVFLLWSWFLFRVSRLDLQLTPTHPDHVGGLGALGWGLASFASVLLAISAVLSGGLAYEIVHRGSSLSELKYHVIVFVVLALIVVHAPLLAFSGRLARCRFRGLLDFGALIGRHDRAFDEKWIDRPDASPENLLGSPDVRSLAAIATVFEHVDEMQLIPFDKKALVVLILAALHSDDSVGGNRDPLTGHSREARRADVLTGKTASLSFSIPTVIAQTRPTILRGRDPHTAPRA